MFRYLLCLSVLALDTFGAPQFMPCPKSDKKCLITLMQGMYEEGWKRQFSSEADPMHLEEIEALPSTFKCTLRDSTLTGLRACHVKDASVKSDGNTRISVTFFCPTFDMVGRYEADGIKDVPTINGRYTYKATNYEIELNMQIEFTIRDGNKYLRTVDFDVDANLQGELDFKVDHGNEELSAATQHLIEDPNYVTQYLQKPIFHANMEKLIDVYNRGYADIPVTGFIV